MADLFTRLARRTLGLMPVVQPRIASRFAREEAMASENTNTEIPSLFEGDRGLAPSPQAAAALSPRESGLREREEESITRTILVEIERESPEKQELTPEVSSVSEERKGTGEEDRGSREKKAIGLTNELTETDVHLEVRAGNKELEGREKIAQRSQEIDLEAIQRVESELGDTKEKETLPGERGTKVGQEVEKSRDAKAFRRESPEAIASEGGAEESPPKTLKVTELERNEEISSRKEAAFNSEREAGEIWQKAGEVKWESRRDQSGTRKSESPDSREGERQIESVTESLIERSISGEREERAIAPENRVTEGKVESRKSQLSTVDSVRELESPGLENREAKKLERNQEISSRKEAAFNSDREAGEIWQKAGEIEWESRRNQSVPRKSENADRGEGERQIASATESLIDRTGKREERAIAPGDRVTEGQVESRKPQLSTVDSVRELESPGLENREAKKLERNQEISSRKEAAFNSDREAGETWQKAGEIEWESRRNQLAPRELENAERREGERQIASVTESLIDRTRSSNEEERAIGSMGESGESANPDKLLGNVLQKTETAEVFSRNVEKSRQSGKAIASGSTEEVQSENRVTAPGLPSRESESNLSLWEQEKQRASNWEQEKQRASKGIEDRGKLSSRREEQLRRSEPETAIRSTEKEKERGKVGTERPTKLEIEQLTVGQIPELYKGSFSAEEARGEVDQIASRSQQVDESRGRMAEVNRQWGENNRNRTTGGIEEIGTQREGRKKGDDRTTEDRLQLLESRLAEERKASVASTPTIQVTIGKIEVRGNKPAIKTVQQSRRKQSTGLSPRLSLDEYLKQRNGC